MRWPRWIEQPRLLASLTLAFALVPVGLAVVTYRDARAKDQKLYETTTQVLTEQLQHSTERYDYFIALLRNQGRSLPREAWTDGKILPASLDWKRKFPHLLGLAYGELVEGRVIVRWIGEPHLPEVKLGMDLTEDVRVAEALKSRNPPDRSATRGVVLDDHRLILMLQAMTNEPGNPTCGYLVGWVDVAALCRDPDLPLLRDGVLTAVPLAKGEATPTGARRVTMHEGSAEWDAGLARGTQFNLQYGAPLPWLAFVAAGLSAGPLLVLVVLAGRSAGLRAALNAEQEVVRRQRFFTQSVSHEFRTPLGIILSGAELLESYASQLTPERRQEVIGEIKENTRHMTEMIERVLLLGRMDANRLDCDPKLVRVAELCEDIVRQVRTASPDREILFMSSANGEARLDAALVRSLLDNLLSNAVKYSAMDQPVTLVVTREETQIRFEVQDRGIGIPAEDLARICDPFHRCKNVGGVPGTGLGLAIAQRCAGLHGGSLSIASLVGQGTTATVLLPLSSGL